MKKTATYCIFAIVICTLACTYSYGQGIMQAAKVCTPLQANAAEWDPAKLPADISIPKGTGSGNHKGQLPKKAINYTSFTECKINKSAEAIAGNAGYEHHPELGQLYPGAPCQQCYELIGERTENTKTFVAEGEVNGHKKKMVQTSTQPMHYRDADGNWRTIITHLQADTKNKGVYTISEETTPVLINTNTGSAYSALGKKGSSIKFNRNLELIYVKPGGAEVTLGTADYSHHTAGDQGMYITNAWPGVDIEMNVLRGAIKTNFHINHAMPEYADGKLLVRDHMELDKGLSIFADGKTTLAGELQIQDKAGMPIYAIGSASVYEEHAIKKTTQPLEYNIAINNTLDIVLPGAYLNKATTSYPLIIDPLVTLATSTTVAGSSYAAALTTTSGCEYVNAANTPANCTVTAVNFTFGYTTVAPLDMVYAGFFMYLGTCRNPGPWSGAATSYVWSCDERPYEPGTCALTTAVDIYSDVATCLPAPSCTSIPLNIDLYLYQSGYTTPACASTYCYGSSPLVITVEGETVALSATTTGVSITATPATICEGVSSVLSATGEYGVPPYTYLWSPGGTSGTPLTVTPGATTTYSLSLVDACGDTAKGTKTVTVNPLTPITGTLSACIGTTSTLSNATAGGTWSSSATAVATIGSTTGVAGGITAGVTTITYTTAAGCRADTTFNVSGPPVAITGTPSVCQDNTTALSDATPDGAWTSSNTAIATVNTAGVVTGVAAGTDIITYGSTGCEVTITVTVNPTPVISSATGTNPTTCGGTEGTIVLSGLVAGDSYIVTYTGPLRTVTVTIIADASGNVTITGLGAGSYSAITVTNTNGCTSAAAGPVVLTGVPIPATPVLTNSSPVCAGGSVLFTATDATTGVTYSWKGPGGFVAPVQNPEISPAGVVASGNYTVTVTDAASGCTSLPAVTAVTVNPTPAISIFAYTDPKECLDTDGTITLNINGVAGNTTYAVAYTDSSANDAETITSDASGHLVITGLGAGNFGNITITTPAGCISNIAGPALLVYPPPPPPPVLAENTPLCVGQTLFLTATDGEQNGIYTWTYPDGTTSTGQNPTIANTTYADAGTYSVMYNVANCLSYATEDVHLYPPITLINLTPNTVIPYGSSTPLNVDGALYYWWSPDNGTLSNPNINNPTAFPKSTTTYTVVGTSLYGCMDTAEVTISIDTTTAIFIPSAFTPNNDGLNDVFRIKNLKYEQLNDFSVFNRWGQLVYHNTYDPQQGWDGTFNGVPQDVGVYNYVIVLSFPDGGTQMFKGDVTLIR